MNYTQKQINAWYQHESSSEREERLAENNCTHEESINVGDTDHDDFRCIECGEKL